MKALTPLKKYKVKVIGAPLLKIFECVCELYIPFIVKNIIDEGFSPTSTHYLDTQFIVNNCLLMFGLAFAGFLCTMVTQYFASRVCSDYNYDLKKELFHHMNSLSSTQIEAYGKNKAVNLISNDALSLQRGVQMYMRLLLRAPFLVIGSVVASFIVAPRFGYIVLGALALCSVIIILVFTLTPPKYQKAQGELDQLSNVGDDNITGSRVIRAFNQQEAQLDKFAIHNDKYARQSMAIERINALVNPLTFAFINGAIILIFYLGKVSFSNNEGLITVGGLVSLVSYLTQSLAALLQFTKLVTSLSKAIASKKRVDEFFSIEPSIKSGELKTLDRNKPLYKFDDVSLSFTGDKNVLEDINFEINEGETIGVIGGTGSGKSVFLSLLNRLNDVSSGALYFYGENIKDYDLSLIKDQVAFVTQTPSFFKGTIKDNLTLGLDYTEDEIISALKLAEAYEFVSKYEDFLNHKVEEKGVNFSGGQKQRLCIARAILSKKKIVVLDDSTSALDYKTDSLVRSHLRNISGLTLIIASQRATSLSGCDKIIVLDEGKIVGIGGHDKLLSSCSLYKEIYETQVSING